MISTFIAYRGWLSKTRYGPYAVREPGTQIARIKASPDAQFGLKKVRSSQQVGLSGHFKSCNEVEPRCGGVNGCFYAATEVNVREIPDLFSAMKCAHARPIRPLKQIPPYKRVMK